MGQTSVGRLHGRLDVLQTSLPPSPSWIQDGGAGNDINQDLGYFFRSLVRWRWKMAALPLPVAILDDLICRKEMRSSKMATGSGRAAIFHLHLNGDRKKYPILLMYMCICMLMLNRIFDDLCIICNTKYAVNSAIKRCITTTIMTMKHQYQGISFP